MPSANSIAVRMRTSHSSALSFEMRRRVADARMRCASMTMACRAAGNQYVEISSRLMRFIASRRGIFAFIRQPMASRGCNRRNSRFLGNIAQPRAINVKHDSRLMMLVERYTAQTFRRLFAAAISASLHRDFIAVIEACIPVMRHTSCPI